VSSAVVHRLQAVHINKGDHEPDSLSPSPIDLLLQLSISGATPQHPGEVIDQVVPPLSAFSIEGGLGSIEPGLRPIQGSLFAVQRRLFLRELLLVRLMFGAAFKGHLISIQIGLVAVKHLLVSIQGLLSLGWFLATVPFLSAGTSLPCLLSPLRRGLPAGRAVRVVGPLGAAFLGFGTFEPRLVCKSLVLHGRLLRFLILHCERSTIHESGARSVRRIRRAHPTAQI
jgi:hypothetical protein